MPFTDFPDWQGLPSLASILASGSVAGSPGGVPLLTFENVLLNATTSIGVATTNVYSPVAVPQIAYNISVQLKEQVVGTNPTADIVFDWLDASSGLLVQTDTYQCWIGSPVASYQVFGRGPTKSNQLRLSIKNYDSQAITAVVNLITESRVYETDIWRTRSTLAIIPGQTLIQSRPESNILAYQVSNVASGAAVDLVLPIWIGHVNYEFQTASAANDAQLFVQMFDTAVTPTAFNTHEVRTNSDGIATGEFWLAKSLYRAHMRNNNAGAQNLSLTMVAVET